MVTSTPDFALSQDTLHFVHVSTPFADKLVRQREPERRVERKREREGEREASQTFQPSQLAVLKGTSFSLNPRYEHRAKGAARVQPLRPMATLWKERAVAKGGTLLARRYTCRDRHATHARNDSLINTCPLEEVLLLHYFLPFATSTSTRKVCFLN